MEARLWLSRTGEAPHSVALTAERTVVGRSPEADVVLEDEAVSWNHLEIERRGDVLMAADLDSRNGTALNGEPLDRPRPTAPDRRPGDRARPRPPTLTRFPRSRKNPCCTRVFAVSVNTLTRTGPPVAR
jgi:pSer/pThr/pTyr-binding forkhead associated (FHA) protein